MMRSPDQRWHEYRWLADPVRIGRAMAILALVGGGVVILAPLLPHALADAAPIRLIGPFFAAAGALGGAVSILDMRRRRAESAKVAQDIDALSTRILCLEERLRARSLAERPGVAQPPAQSARRPGRLMPIEEGDLHDWAARAPGATRAPRAETPPLRRDEESSRKAAEKRVTPSLLPPRE